MDSEQPVYIGVPITSHLLSKEEDGDPYTSKLGGKPAWLRPVKPISTPEDRRSMDDSQSEFACPKCRSCSQTKLVSQLHCPLAVFDRILYVFMCMRCSHSLDESFLFCLRSQLYNPDYEAEQPAGVEAETPQDKGPMFAVEEDDGWGEEPTSQMPAQPTPSPVAEAPTRPSPIFEVYPTATREDQRDSNVSVTTTALPSLALDTFEEPNDEAHKRKQRKHMSLVDAVPTTLEEAEALIEKNLAAVGGGTGDGEVVEGNDNADDATGDGTADERQMDEFVKRMGRYPSQCVRWSPGGVPLSITASKQAPKPSEVPHCEQCGAPRRFEFQLMPPTLYFLEKFGPNLQTLPKLAPDANPKQVQDLMNKLSSREDPHFSTVTVYTCSENCYLRKQTASVEFLHVEPEQ